MQADQLLLLELALLGVEAAAQEQLVAVHLEAVVEMEALVLILALQAVQ